MISLEAEPGGLLVLRFGPPYGPDDEGGYLAALERISALADPFALMVVLGGGPGLSRDGERAQALWFKRSRNHIEACCRALAMVRPQVTPRMSEVFGKLWRIPLTTTDDEGAARRFLAPFLATS
ncbi:hypothetical protein L2U69_13110 [Zavarzinia compransoris]|uniref:hypothetical protein n=1 Tax=Zavarzinia marina TaxID=2911065 RepID=UPI001F163426|nr:hypothetical protein [Zavarzinia marina]MCF4166586.1 hypothetical protein [Zavarzinia marina]